MFKERSKTFVFRETFLKHKKIEGVIFEYA